MNSLIFKILKDLFIIYDDFQYVLIPSTDNIDFGPNSKKYQDHIVCSYSYKLICADDQYSKPDKTYFGEDAIDKFLNDMMKESEYCSKVNLLLRVKKIMKILIVLLNVGFVKKHMKKVK